MDLKEKILSNLCYTPLVYDRINKKLKISLSNKDIEQLMRNCITSADEIIKRGKNYYAINVFMNIVVTINSNNYRVITASKKFATKFS
ncbi:DUF3781 domain-containing protein [Pediococcus argentinicus]|uniref:DUF3781 domain-containing protein n=1 Tax=Pediococcus argentinicus TaxID=480391 RepID=UPI00338F229F